MSSEFSQILIIFKCFISLSSSLSFVSLVPHLYRGCLIKRVTLRILKMKTRQGTSKPFPCSVPFLNHHSSSSPLAQKPQVELDVFFMCINVCVWEELVPTASVCTVYECLLVSHSVQSVSIWTVTCFHFVWLLESKTLTLKRFPKHSGIEYSLSIYGQRQFFVH